MNNPFSGPAGARRATVDGTAYNAKAGAIIETADGTPVYIKGLEQWPDQQVNQPVSRSGILSRQAVAPSSAAVDGVVRQGMDSLPWVLEPD